MFPRLRSVLACALLLVPLAHAAPPHQAPEFAAISQWLNSPPLTMKALRGKVVLIDFWAYSCINCLRTLPHVTAWYDRYRDEGLVVVGVHSPEFEFGKSAANVEKAIAKFGIHYPVAMDNDMATWRAWDNHYWPSEYLVDRGGQVIMHHVGEGHYEQTEQAIRKALGLGPMTRTVADKDFRGVGSPEMYFGLARQANLANPHLFARLGRDYVLPDKVALNRFALGGEWKLHDEYAELTGADGDIRLHFQAGTVHMVAAAGDQPVTLTITVDGKPQPDVVVTSSRLYTLFESAAPGEHTINIHVADPGLRAYTFTFG